MVIKLELLHKLNIRGLHYIEDTFKIITLHTKKHLLYSNLEYLAKSESLFGGDFSFFPSNLG